jgi:hypothetical protein
MTINKSDAIYIASKTKYAFIWKRLRQCGFNIKSTWIDEADIGQTKDFKDLAERCINEIKECKYLILYNPYKKDIMTGALIEVGIAIAFNKIIICVGDGSKLGTTFSKLENIFEIENMYELINNNYKG